MITKRSFARLSASAVIVSTIAAAVLVSTVPASAAGVYVNLDVTVTDGGQPLNGERVALYDLDRKKPGASGRADSQGHVTIKVASSAAAHHFVMWAERPIPATDGELGVRTWYGSHRSYRGDTAGSFTMTKPHAPVALGLLPGVVVTSTLLRPTADGGTTTQTLATQQGVYFSRYKKDLVDEYEGYRSEVADGGAVTALVPRDTMIVRPSVYYTGRPVIDWYGDDWQAQPPSHSLLHVTTGDPISLTVNAPADGAASVRVDFEDSESFPAHVSTGFTLDVIDVATGEIVRTEPVSARASIPTSIIDGLLPGDYTLRVTPETPEQPYATTWLGDTVTEADAAHFTVGDGSSPVAVPAVTVALESGHPKPALVLVSEYAEVRHIGGAEVGASERVTAGAHLEVDDLMWNVTHDGETVTPSAVDYQWYRNGTPITGAIHHTYTVTSADVAHRLTVKVTGRGDDSLDDSPASTVWSAHIY